LPLVWSERPSAAEVLFYFLASATAIPERPEMEFIFPLDFRSYGFGDLPIWLRRGRGEGGREGGREGGKEMTDEETETQEVADDIALLL